MSKTTATTILKLAVLCLLGFAIAFPFFWMASTSFKPRSEMDEGCFLPKEPTTSNYPVVLDIKPDPVTGKFLKMKFGRWYFNGLFIAFVITFIQVFTSAMAAYAFSRVRWRGRDTVFFMYLTGMMVPGVVAMIPNFQLMLWFGWLDTYQGLILPMAFSAFGTFLLRQFMMAIPTELDECAKVEGASHWIIFWNITLPLARPGLVALGIITFLTSYQSFLWPLVVASDEQHLPLSVGLLRLNTAYGSQTEFLMAAAVMGVAPLIIVFAALQKYLVKGLQYGAIKGS